MNEEPISYSDEKILVADDEQDFSEILLTLLSHRGFTANFVSNGNDALLELKSDNTYTFLVTDIQMPEMNGLELTERVTKDFPDIAVIVMTGYTEEHRYIDVVNAGAIDFINKPFRIEELEAKIRRAINERNIRSELKRLTITDSVTGLYNQRYFYSRLKDEIIRSKRQDRKLAVMLLDLDNFKQFNDKYGHVAGDDVLQKFGNIIQSQIRQGVDSGFRYGGDEFAIILVDATEETCIEIGKRIEIAFEKECNACVSTGHAVFTGEMTPEDFVSEADKHLYSLKGKRKEEDIILF